MSELERYQEPTIAIAGEIPPVDDWPLVGRAVPDGADVDELTGAAASPGLVTGRARVVTNAYADDPTEPGEILVAPITDPGWMPLFIGAVGVVTEMGGELSHTMIVSRELGIPAVVGVVGATGAIRSGDLIEIDGSAGTVRRARTSVSENALRTSASTRHPRRGSFASAIRWWPPCPAARPQTGSCTYRRGRESRGMS